MQAITSGEPTEAEASRVSTAAPPEVSAAAAGRGQHRRDRARALGGAQGRRRRQPAGDRRDHRDHDLLHGEDEHLLHRRQLLEPDRPDGRRDGDRGRHRLRAPDRRDRPLRRLRQRHRAAWPWPSSRFPARATTTPVSSRSGSRSASALRSAPRRARSSPFLGVPSFVVTLAGLPDLPGDDHLPARHEGVIGIQDHQINDVANYVLARTPAGSCAIVFTALLAIGSLRDLLQPAACRPADREPAPDRRCASSSTAVWSSRPSPSATTRAACRSSAWSSSFVVVLFSYLAGRTTVRPARLRRRRQRRGRAPRRHQRQADPDPLLRHLRRLAGLGGVILASRLNSVDLTFGGGTLLLDAISAAVIGGVSLFGGRGRVSGALFGGLIIGMIATAPTSSARPTGQVRHDRVDPARRGDARHGRAPAPGRRRPLSFSARPRRRCSRSCGTR